MNISFDLLKVFKVVAFYGSVSKAAKVLCVTQPSVTKAIKKLESNLEMLLFARDKKGMILTDSGERLYKYIVDSINILDGVELLAKNININDVGILRIGASESVTRAFLRKTIVEYKKLHPRIRVDVVNSNSKQLYTDLKYGKLDLIFINSRVIVNNKYNTFKLVNVEDCFFTTPEHYNTLENVTNLKSILSQSLIVLNQKYDTRLFLDDICLKNNIKLEPVLELDRHSLIAEFVKDGLGIGFATKQYIQRYFDSGELIEIPVNFKIEKRFINTVYKKDNNKKVNDFLNLLKYNIGDIYKK